jgi:hypothetical protein
MLGAHVVQNGVRKGIEHAVAGAGADHEIVGKGYNLLDVDQYDVLSLLILQGVDNFPGKVESFQKAPLV